MMSDILRANETSELNSLREEVARLRAKEAEREQMLAALRESEARYRRIIETTQDGVCLVSAGGSITFASARFAQMYGYGAPEMIGMSVYSLVPSEDVADTRVRVVALLRGDEITGAFRAQRKDGSIFWTSVQVRPIIGDDGTLREVLNLVSDETERKDAETQQAESELQYRTLADALPQMVWVLRPNGTILYANRTWYDYTGLPDEDHRDAYLGVALHPDDQAAARSRFGGVDETGNGYEAESRIRRHDGQYRWHLSRIVPMKAPTGAVRLVLVIATDIHERHEAADALRKSEAQYRGIVEAAHEGISVIGADTRLTYASPRFAAMLGYRVNELIGMSARALTPPDAVASEETEFEWRKVEPSRRNQIQRMQCKDGTIIHVQVNTTPITDDDGATLGVLAMTLDVTEQQRAEVEHENYNRALIDSLPQLVSILDANGVRQYANRAWHAYTGLSNAPAQMTGESFVHPDDLPTLYNLWQKTEPGATHEAEARLRRHDGQYRWHIGRISPIFDTHGTLTGWANSYTDIHARRELEDDLRRNQQQLQTIVDNAQAYIYTKSRDGHYNLVNRRFEDFFQRPVNELIGMSDYDLLPPDQADVIVANDRAVIDGGQPLTLEESATHADGTIRTHLSVKVPLYNTQGVAYALVGISTDITERKEFEAVQIELSHLKDLFLSIAGHELRTPLTAVKGYGQMAQREIAKQTAAGNAAAVQRLTGHIDKILAQTERAIGLTGELLDTARIERGQLTLTRTPGVNVAALVADVVEQQRDTAGRTISLDSPDPDLSADVDKERIEQVLYNLIGNARKYSPDGAPIAVTVAQTDDAIEIAVRDAGYGIDAETQKHLFEPFYRARKTEIAHIQGLGLGLYICQQIVAQHGGSLTVESTPGVGSTFTVRLPV